MKLLGRAGFVWAGVLGLFGALGSSAGCGTVDEPGGTGGKVSSSGEGGAPAAGGAPGSGTSGGVGGVSSGSGGRSFECDPGIRDSSGGAIYIPECHDWLREPNESESLPGSDIGILRDGCSAEGGATGEGGANTSEPALARLCARFDEYPDYQVSLARLGQEIRACLIETLDSRCTSTHEAEVRDCLRILPPCWADLDSLGCTQLQKDCPTLETGLCYWGMRNAGFAEAEQEVIDCLGAKRPSESCNDRFLQCAWGI